MSNHFNRPFTGVVAMVRREGMQKQLEFITAARRVKLKIVGSS